jgi:hypothetical protein
MPLSANWMIDPPPPTPPRHALTRAEGGEKKTNSILRHTFAFSRRVPPEFCYELPALQTEGAGNAGRLVRPPPRVRKS